MKSLSVKHSDLIYTSRYSSRVNYDVACAMDFNQYPIDEQTCEIKFESFGYTSKQVSKYFSSKHTSIF